MDKLQPFTKKIPTTERAEFAGGSKFCNGDTIMARITPCLENGKTAFVDILADGEVAFGSTEFIVMRAKAGKSDPQFIYYLATSPAFRNVAIKSMVGSSGRQRVQQGVLDELELLVPPLDTQKKIGAFLAALDKKIALNSKINDNLQQQAATIFHRWFVNNPDSEKWPMVTLDDLTSLVSRGIAPKYDDESAQIVLNQKCIRDHYIDISLGRRHKPKAINEKWLQYGDLLINSTGEGTLGRAAQVWFIPENMTVDSHVTVVRPMNQLLLFYIGLWGISHEREIEALHTGSTGQTELPRERVKAMELRLPDNDTLVRFNAVISPMVSAIIANQKENTRMASIRDALLPKLMSGEIDVSSVDI
jgi:type I restriction enzyme S subunit